jgi:hypothetical protein
MFCVVNLCQQQLFQSEAVHLPFISGQLIRHFNWGPAQPSGGPQHCMYVVGGILGYQWADFHCDFEMNFFCEHQE